MESHYALLLSARSDRTLGKVPVTHWPQQEENRETAGARYDIYFLSRIRNVLSFIIVWRQRRSVHPARLLIKNRKIYLQLTLTLHIFIFSEQTVHRSNSKHLYQYGSNPTKILQRIFTSLNRTRVACHACVSARRLALKRHTSTKASSSRSNYKTESSTQESHTPRPSASDTPNSQYK